MKHIYILIFVFISINLSSQNKDLVILDADTKEAINLVHISYPTKLIGSVSNEDGRVKIPLIEKENIYFSHINYDEKQISCQNLRKLDTIFLNPKRTTLNEVVVYNVNLKNKLSYVLKNYLKYYSKKNIVNNCTYKETSKINDSLVRLFQIQFKWWSKNYIYQFGESLNKKNKFIIENVDYSKIREGEFYQQEGAGIENQDFIKFLHLNFLLSVLINNTEDIMIKSINKNNLSTEILFSGIVKEDEKIVYNFNNSSIIFNNKDGTINYVELNMKYNDSNLYKSVSRVTKTAYEAKIVSHTIKLSFSRSRNKKLFVNYFISEASGIYKIKEKITNFNIQQKLFITETKTGKKLKNEGVNLSKPFYLNLTKNTRFTNSRILLTNEEVKFIKK
jgi:hypothetical protein